MPTTRYFVDPAGAFLGAFETPDDAEPNWPADAIEVAEPPPDGRMLRQGGQWVSPAAFLTALAGARRWEIETGGITLPGGIVVATDAVAQAKIDAALAAFERGALTGSITFKSQNGFVDLDQAGLTAVYDAVVAHVQACYAAESAVVDEIDAGTITDAAGVESSPHWPG